MRAFILIAALATAIVYTAHGMPSSSLATYRAFNDVVDSVTYVSHPSHHHDKYHRGKKGDKGEEGMTLGQAVRGPIHLTVREEQEKSIARWEKETKRGRMLRGRTIKNVEYGSGSAPAGPVAAVAYTQTIPSPSPTAKSLATPYSTKIPDSAKPIQAAYARHARS